MRRSVTCYGFNVVLTLLAMETFLDLVVRSGGYVEGVGI